MSPYAFGDAVNGGLRSPASAQTVGPEPGSWAVAMAELAIELNLSSADPKAMVEAVAAAAVKILPGVTAAGVVRIGKGGVLTCQAATNPQVLQMVQAEHRAGQGPCRPVLDQAGPGKIVMTDLAAGHRWRQYGAEALSIGIAAVMAVRLDWGNGAADEALLLITDTQFDRRVLDDVDVFAAHSAVATARARTHADLLAAVQGRDAIGQAKGIVMERYKITSEQAFALLVKASQDTNVALRQVADRLVDTGEHEGIDSTPKAYHRQIVETGRFAHRGCR